MKIQIGIVDDHQLFVSSLKLLLETDENFEVTLVAYGGSDLEKKINKLQRVPDIILVDVKMKDWGGCKTTRWLREFHPSVKIAALSMNSDDTTVIRMLRSGCCAYFFKNIKYEELSVALNEIYKKGFYNGDECNIKFRRLAIDDNLYKVSMPSEKELEFLQYACSDLTYVQIADKMKCSKRTVDGYRESLFVKFKVQSRVGLCLEALRRELVDL